MKNKITVSPHRFPAVFVFLLIGLFAVSSLTLALIGTRVYSHVTETASQNSDSQMVLSYLCNKVRTFDSTGNIALSQRDGLPLLCLYESIEGEKYETAVYAYDGALWERFMPASEAASFAPGDGEKLVEIQSLRFTLLASDLLEASVVMPNGDARTLRMALRAGSVKEAI